MKNKAKKSQMLNPGDVIMLKEGQKIYVTIPEHFVYGNRKGVFNKLAQTDITIGENRNGFDTSWFAGKYIVTKAQSDGGGTGHGPHDVYPDGWHVTCMKAFDKGIGNDKVEVEINFYQSGCFTAMIEEVEVVGHAKIKYEVES